MDEIWCPVIFASFVFAGVATLIAVMFLKS